MKTLIVIIMLALVGCGGSGGGSSTAAPKSLFSLWTSDQWGSTIDLTNGSLGNNISYDVLLNTGETCSCNLNASGTEASGAYVVSGCTYTGGGSGDPGCVSMNETGTFTCAASVLTLTSGATSEVYH